MKQEYEGLRAEKVTYRNEFETVRVQSGCYSIMAFTQGPQGHPNWQLCQEAIDEGEDDNFGEWWLLPKEIYP